MMKLSEMTSFADAQAHACSDRLWELFDGDRETMNITHECILRHADGTGRPAVSIAHGDGENEIVSFDDLAATASQFANWLDQQGVQKGDRIAVMLPPSLLNYACLFGAILHGSIAVPLFTLFGPDALRLRVDDCNPVILVTDAEKADDARSIEGPRVLLADDKLLAELEACSARYIPHSKADDLAFFQYTSGTTRELPEAVKHTHRSVVTLMYAALYGTGIRPGDRFFCPSSPAWGHGLVHGTMAPLAMGVSTGTMGRGRFDPVRMMQALEEFGITNLSAAATHYRMMKNSGRSSEFAFGLKKMSFTGEPIDEATLDWIDGTFGIDACSMYGTTEIGVVLVNYPGAQDFKVKPGSLGKPVPGLELQVQRPDGTPTDPGEIGELMLKRKTGWLSTKDQAKIDEDGYFYHCGRADDVIISAGWTMSAVEIENTMLKHDDVLECAVIGAPDEKRGLVVKAFVISKRAPSAPFVKELQDFTRTRLAQHEFPRLVEFVDELPKTPAGKVNRKILRDREAAAAAKAA
ncbi:acyl-CoA synthetase [Erythrobacter alti]|uniref:acyl-CoA synthetase n=1 Tax=Erythrobacter alti TaxID=1896145 RepID=UPI0030F4B0F5